MKQKVGLVLLATNKEPELGCICVRMGLEIWNDQFDKPHHNQHLYLTSNEEVKECDYYYSKLGKSHNQQIRKSSYNRGIITKIIASTDKSLGLPGISDEDLQDYIKSYNTGNIITEWEVEVHDKEYRFIDRIIEVGSIKTTPDNNVIICKEEKLYIEEEVEILLGKYRLYAWKHGLSLQDFRKWIKTNLK